MVTKKKHKLLFMSPTKLCVWNAWKTKAGPTCFLRLHHVALFTEQCSIPSQFHGSHEQCFFKKSMQLIDFTHTVHMNVNNNFYFKKKISLRWIKFIHTIISILFLIIFYLILLHAQKIMETVVFVGLILYVIEL